MLIFAIISITLALIFYTVGVWSQKKQGSLKKWHLVILYLGLLCDILGTTLMSKLAKGGFQLDFHGIIGLFSILLMLLTIVLATITLVKNDNMAKSNFHKISIPVWAIWLISYVSGALSNM